MKQQINYKIVAEGQSVDYAKTLGEAQRTFDYFIEEWGFCKLYEITEEKEEGEGWEIVNEDLIKEVGI